MGVAMTDWIDHLFADARVVELRHAVDGRWTCGTFDDAGLLRAEVERRGGTAELYTTINAPAATGAANAMRGQPLRDVDIGHHVRLPFDFDPVRPADCASTKAELGAAVAARDRLVIALSALGWPAPAVAISGNGAHAVYRCRFRVSPESREVLTVLYRGLGSDFGADSVRFDTAVRNPARVWRLYSTTNRKGKPTADRPHRLAAVRIPQQWRPVGLRDVEALANRYARRQRPAPSPAESASVRLPPGDGDYRSLDVVDWFAGRSLYRRPLGNGMHAVRCPWDHEHSTVDDEHSTATVIWEAHGHCWPNFRCLHAHCDGRGIRDVLAALGDADRYCARTFERGAA